MGRLVARMRVSGWLAGQDVVGVPVLGAAVGLAVTFGFVQFEDLQAVQEPGDLEPRRIFIIRPRDQELSLPSDLAGVTVLDYRHNRRDGNLQAAIGPAATVIHRRIAAEGSRIGRAASLRITPTRAPWTGTTINEPEEPSKAPEEFGDVGKWQQLDHLADQMYQWPELTEQYPRYDVYLGHTQREGSVYILLGWTKRAGAWGRNRIYVVAFLSRRSPQTPLVEFLETATTQIPAIS